MKVFIKNQNTTYSDILFFKKSLKKYQFENIIFLMIIAFIIITGIQYDIIAADFGRSENSDLKVIAQVSSRRSINTGSNVLNLEQLSRDFTITSDYLVIPIKTGDEDVIVAFLTDTGAGESLAYSNDKGRTFTWYEGNPVVEHRGRDPKVIWYAYDKETQPLNDTASQLGGHWVMAVYDESAGGRNIAFYASTNLKSWTEQSHLMGFFECPEIFKLPVDGNAEDARWVVSAADARYVIGSFDGKTFTPKYEDKNQLHYGNYYAAQTFDNAPDGRHIQIGWVKIEMTGMPFNQTFSFPHELTLRKTAGGIRMFAEPVKEIEKLYSKTHTVQNKSLTENQPVSINTSDQLFDIHAVFNIGSAEQIGLQIGEERVIYDTKSTKLNEAVMEPLNGQVTIRVLVDRPMMEIIGNNGRVYITKPRNPGDVPSIQAFAIGGNATLSKLDIHELNTIWE